MPGPRWRADGTLEGHVVYIDHFGNCISDVRIKPLLGQWLLIKPPGEGSEPVTMSTGRLRVLAGNMAVPQISQTYADGLPGELVALVGSAGHLEIACVEGNAAHVLGLAIGDTVIVDPESG
jgi:S-adenosylmethionine hydrolase